MKIEKYITVNESSIVNKRLVDNFRQMNKILLEEGKSPIYDELTIIVKGDLNGDGKVNLIDYLMVQKYLTRILNFNSIQLLAGDINLDDLVTTPDFTFIRDYCNEIIDSLN